jgi:hypothetical protein
VHVGPASTCTVMQSAPARAKAPACSSTGTTMRCTSRLFAVCGRNAATTAEPSERLGTKWPSITSTWIQSAPASSIARTSSPSRQKSAARMEAATRVTTARAPGPPRRRPAGSGVACRNR